MAQSQNRNALRHQNPGFLLDALYCDEPHYLDQEYEPQEESFCTNNNKNVDNDARKNRSNPDPLLPEVEDQICAEEELRLLLTKELEDVNLFRLCGSSLAMVRSDVVEWMLNVSARYAFSAVTAVLAVNYFDRFFCSNQRQVKQPWMTQLAAVSCLSLAAKVEETHVPLLVDLQVGNASFVFEAKTIQRMEIVVLSTLQWKMYPATPLSFVEYIARNLGLSYYFHFVQRCERLLLLVICNSRFHLYFPSAIAMAIVLQVMDDSLEPSLIVDYQNKLFTIPEFNKEKLGDCRELIKQCKEKSLLNKRKLESLALPALPCSPVGVIDASFRCDSSDVSSSGSGSSPENRPKKNRALCLENLYNFVSFLPPR